MFRVIHPNRWFFWTIVILVLAGAGLLFFINQGNLGIDQQSAELVAESVPTWKIYRSAALGFSVRYPAAWQIDVDPQADNGITLENPQNFDENIAIFKIEPQFEKVIRASLKVDREEPVTVDGHPGTWIYGQNTKDVATSNVIFVPVDGSLYYFAGQARNFSTILKSVKFLGNERIPPGYHQ